MEILTISLRHPEITLLEQRESSRLNLFRLGSLLQQPSCLYPMHLYNTISMVGFVSVEAFFPMLLLHIRHSVIKQIHVSSFPRAMEASWMVSRYYRESTQAMKDMDDKIPAY